VAAFEPAKTRSEKANPDHFLDSGIVKSLKDQGFLRQIGRQKIGETNVGLRFSLA
jgi:hypothetical protein